jgi:tetratricopeptide (TPR) repeat protein
VILPFVTGYNVPDHLGLAVAEEMIGRLSRLAHPTVAVLARDSSFALAGAKQTAQQTGQMLNADFAICGSLSALATHFRLRAEMIRVADGVQIWAEDMLVPQSRIACLEFELVERLLVRLNSGGLSIDGVAETVCQEHRSEREREAYESYLRGRHQWQTMQRHLMQDGLQQLFKAVELDPSLTAARVEIARVSVAQAYYGFMAPVVAADHIRRAAGAIPDFAQRAEGILPALGWISFHVDHDLTGALQSFSASSHLPHDLWTTHMRTMFALSRKRFDEAIGLVTDALRDDPYSPWLHARLAWALHLAEEAERSVDQIRRTIKLFPQHEGGAFYGSLILAYNGEAEEASQLAHGLTNRFAYFDLATSVHAYALACAGKTDEAQAILERMQWLSRERFLLISFLPAVQVALGDLNAAVAELKSSEKTRCPWFFQMLADPRLKALNGHPEFERLQSILPRMESSLQLDPVFSFQ